MEPTPPMEPTLFLNQKALDELFNSDRFYQTFESFNEIFGEKKTVTTNCTFDKNALYLHVSVPGFKKEELHVVVTSKNELEIMGQIQGDQSPINRGHFAKNFKLSYLHTPGYDFDIMSATLKNGILIVRIPRKPLPVEPREVWIVEITT